MKKWVTKYRGDDFSPRMVTVNRFRPFVDSIVSLILSGDLDPDELDGAVWVVHELIKQHKRRNPDWKPTTSAEKDLELRQKINLANRTVRRNIIS